MTQEILNFKYIPSDERHTYENDRDPDSFMEKLEEGNARLANELRIEPDPVVAHFHQEQLRQIRFIGASILGLVIILGLGGKYVDANREEITEMRERMYADSGHIPEPELPFCQKITRDNFFAKVGRPVARLSDKCEAELAGINSNPTTIVSFNTEGRF